MELICPNCHGEIRDQTDRFECGSCGNEFQKQFDVWDFTFGEDDPEKEFYEEDYERKKFEKFEMRNAKSFWHNQYQPENFLFFDTLQPLEGKTVLLLGNGFSLWELYFLTFGANLVYTDLSALGVSRVKEVVQQELSSERDRLAFYAVDGLSTPFPDRSFDVVYGHGFAHHIPDKSKLLKETNRILRPGGKAVFRDVAYSWIWEGAKNTILKPLQMYAHWRTGISPQDRRATKEGGFRKSEVLNWFDQADIELGEDNFIWKKCNFFLHLWQRGVNKLVGIDALRRLGQPVFKWLDRICSNFRWHERNQLRLVWGYKKKSDTDS